MLSWTRVRRYSVLLDVKSHRISVEFGGIFVRWWCFGNVTCDALVSSLGCRR